MQCLLESCWYCSPYWGCIYSPKTMLGAWIEFAEWCQRYLPCYILTVSHFVCFFQYIARYAAPALWRTIVFNMQYRTSEVAENLGRYRSCTERSTQVQRLWIDSNGKMENRHLVEGPLGSEIPAICNHCGVMTAWSLKTWKFCEQFLLFWQNDPSQTVATPRIAPKICQGQPAHLAHIVPDFIQIGLLSAELLQNA